MLHQAFRPPGQFLPPRTLIPFDLARVPRRQTDVLVIGSGLAGLRAALEVRRRKRRVVVVAKGDLLDSNTAAAQGGIAAAIGPDDDVQRHTEDTLRVGEGLAETSTVRSIVMDGLNEVRELIDSGVPFDRTEGDLALAREGGHTRSRILHRGDRTGRAILDRLLERVEASGARIEPNTFLIDLLVHGRVCLGALCADRRGRPFSILASSTILATGGAGQLFRETTNPSTATGDGIAAAFRAGATLSDLEFVQFHPTVLYLPGAPRALITEAVRGAGAVLRDRTGEAFMARVHPLGDLAPRDVVSRAIRHRIQETGDTQCYLDARSFRPAELRRRFPQLAALCARYRIDPRHELIPVRPAAHYLIGGVRIDAWGRTGLPGLYAAGECAASGFHGANRLASNSLLECLVFGKRAGAHAAEEVRPRKFPRLRRRRTEAGGNELDLLDLRNTLQTVLWRHAGVERTETGLEEALRQISRWSRMLFDSVFSTRSGWELQNMLTLGTGLLLSARRRRESRGVHYRSDFPKPRRSYLKHFDVVSS